ncbi:MAG: S8 family serine peptidase [Thermoanaerobaculia bacterium]
MPRRSFPTADGHSRWRRALGATVAAWGLFFLAGLFAQGLPPTLQPAAIDQLRLLTEWKSSRSAAERKIDSTLLFALDRRAGRTATALSSIEALAIPSDGRIEVDIDLVAPADLAPVAEQVRRLGGAIRFASRRFLSLRATLAVEAVRPLAEASGVRRIVAARPAFTHGVVSEGDRAHGADTARDLHGLDGRGIKICALSNGVDELVYSQATGELPAVEVLPGQEGGGGEGTAMLEIVHDLAPGAALGFATAFGGVAQFAQNILDLAASGCQVIVDDVIYLVESPFQDGDIAAAVDAVSAQGVLYLASAGNEGNLDDGTSGTWQGDFLAGAPLPALPGLELHDFGAGSSNLLLKDAPAVVLHWTDPFGTAANDYDLYVLTGDLANVARFSNNTQDGIGGDDDPVEIISFFGSGASQGERLVVVRAAGAGRLLNLIAFRGELEQATRSALRGHAAAAAALAIAAAPAAAGYAPDQPSGPYPLEFDASQASETFSADGPRRIFFSPQGELLPGAPPGDFSSAGGVVREKPDLTAADGVATSVDGFTRFFGTSAAAPHAAAIAALYWSALPTADAATVRAALLDQALDIEAPGPDPTTGRGLVDPGAMLAAAAVPLRANLELGAVVPVEVAGNGDAVLDPGERWRLAVELRNVGGAAAQAVAGGLATASPAAVITFPVAAWDDLPAGAVSASADGFEIALAPQSACGTIVPFSMTVTYDGGIAPETFSFELVLGAPGTPVPFVYGGPPVFIADSPQRGMPGPPALALLPIAGLGGRLADLDLSFDGELCSIAQFATTVGIQHPFVSNLLIELVAPSGRTVPMVRFTDGLGNHFCQTLLDDESAGPSIQSVETDDNPFSGTYRPARPLSLFDGEDPDGTWTLRVTDWNPLDVGYVRAFTLTATPAVCRAFIGTVEIPAARTTGLVILALLLAATALRRLVPRRPNAGGGGTGASTPGAAAGRHA